MPEYTLYTCGFTGSILKEMYLYCQLTICVDSGSHQKNCRIQFQLNARVFWKYPEKRELRLVFTKLDE